MQHGRIPSTQTHPTGNPAPTGAHRRWRRVVVIVLAVVLATVVLRSPLSVLTLIGTASPQDPTEPDKGPLGSVGEIVTRRAGDGGDPTIAAEGLPGGDVSDGRWGAAPVRPGGLDIRLEELRGGWRVEGGTEEAAALGVIAAHAWADARSGRTAMSDAGAVPGTGLGAGSGERAGAIVTVEAVERPGALHAVVTLLVADARGLHRIAVPIVFAAEGPAVASEPWRLPGPVATVPDVVGDAVGDPELLAAARSALETIGIPGGRLLTLEATDGWPFIARLDDGTDGHPWLRWHLDRFVVAGLPLRSGGGPR